MKLYKALKLRKNLIGEITKLKTQIKEKNSYLEGSKNGEKFKVIIAYDELLLKIAELTSLKFVINEANREIQSKIYLLGEHKALIAFWNEVSVVEGAEKIGYGDNIYNYVAQIDEKQRDKMVGEFQIKVDAIQDELDEFNFNTEIPWGDMGIGEVETIEVNLKSNDEEMIKTINENLKVDEKENCGCDKGNCCGHDEQEQK